MKLAVFGHAFDGHDVRSVRLDCKHRARFHGKAVRQDRARAADAGFASDVRARQFRHVTDEVRQQKPRLNILFVNLSINFDFRVHT